MKRNSIFNSIPLLRPKRNTFNLSFENKLSTDLFRLTPILCKEVLPDDVFKIRPEIFCRVSPMISPIFHRLNIRTYYFFVPTRIIWKDFETWINPKSGTTDIVAPKLTVEDSSESGIIYGNFAPKTLADYLGVNFGLNASDQSNLVTFTTKMQDIFPMGFTISSLPFRAYQQIYNDWFIDLNNVDVAEFSKDSGVEVLGADDDDDLVLENNLLKMRYRAWEHDYFTSALPEPQRGPDVNAFDGGTGSITPGGGSDIDVSDLVIVPKTNGADVQGRVESLTNLDVKFDNEDVSIVDKDTGDPVDVVAYIRDNYSSFGFNSESDVVSLFNSGAKVYFDLSKGYNVQRSGGSYSYTNEPPYMHIYINNDAGDLPDYKGAMPANWEVVGQTESYSSANLGRTQVPASNIASALKIQSNSRSLRDGDSEEVTIPAVTVEELRVRMQMQSFLERNEVAGSRYTELLYAHWGVKDPDGRLQRSEFLGGCKQPIVISDVTQMVNTDDEPLGAYAGQATSSSAGRTIKFRAPEHGYIIGITTIVPRSGYSQGIHPMWTRFDRLDYFWPSFAHLGEQEVKYKELMFTGINPEQTFGYQQRYAEYKSANDEIHGDMKGSLAHWHMSRIFDTPASADDMPKLSEYFTTPQDSDADALSRVWPVASTGFEVANADHFVLDIYQHIFASRRMPKYATPRNGS